MKNTETSYRNDEFQVQVQVESGERSIVGKRGISKMEKTYITTDEAAEYLNVTRETLYKILNKGLLTKYRPVRRIYIKKEELIKLKQEGSYKLL